MATIAELQIKVDSTETERGTKALLALAEAADKAAAARKRLNDIRGGGGGPPGGGDDSETRRTRSLSEAIDSQTRKLADLARQRKALNESPLRTENPAEYARLNALLDARTESTRRQGNALDRLSEQAKREQEQRQKAADAAQRIAEREARLAQQKEEREARNAVLAQRRLDATISSLSRQVKAQEDYNRTVAQLNAARAPTTGTASLGQAQYETYVRQAAAIRDAALAQADNSREIERAQRLYDASVASLGKVERAQALYAKNLKDSDNALRLNLITQEQYNTQVAAFAARRDASIAATNSNSQAEARLAAQLQGVLSAYDPVLRATDSYNSSVRVLVQGLQSGKLTVEQFNKALTDQRTALDSVKSAQSGSTESQAKQYQAALDRLLPFNAQLRNLAESERVLKKAKDDGKVTTEQQIKDYERATKAIAAERAEIERRSQAERRGNSAKQDAAALRGLPAQFTDVVVSLQGGQAPLTVLLQQGGQVKDMFGGIGAAAKAVGGALLAMVTPLTIAAAAVSVMAIAFYQGNREAVDFNKAIAQSAGFSGATVTSFYRMQKAISSTVGTLGSAAEALSAMQRSGKISVEQFEAIGIAAIKMEKATGQSIKDTVADFASLAKDPSNAVLTLDEKYKGLTSSVYAQITALQRSGDTINATILAQETMAAGAGKMADNIRANLGSIETAWKALKEAAGFAWDAMLGVGRMKSAQDNLKELQDGLAQMEKGAGSVYIPRLSKQFIGDEGKKALQDQISLLKQAITFTKNQDKAKTELNKKEEQARVAGVAAQVVMDSATVTNMKQSERLKESLEKVRLAYASIVTESVKAGRPIDPKQTEQYIANILAGEKKIKDAREQEVGGKTNPLDTRDVQEVKSNLNVITSQYDAAYKKITALGKANVVSQEATFASQKALLEQEKNAVAASYDEQIAAIKKLQGVKGNNASQNISLDNQLTRAEDARLKSMQDMDAKMEVLATAEKGRLQRRTDAIEAYNEALRTQIDNVKTSGERAVSAVGQGDRQTTLNANLADVDRQFAKDQASLAKQLSKGMDPVENAANLKNLTEAHNEMTQQILRNDADIQAANADWTNGFTKAVQNLADEANNMAGAVNSAVSGAFASMGDALGTFVTTGKLDFKSLASSILSDMAKIAARAATNAALSSLFGAAASAYGGASAGTTTGSTGFSEYGAYPQAKGGGWSGGTQFFAQGGAFTNSIVSSPTAFGMSGGGRGVMGEAGPEAIVPLARAADGSLGVRLVGGAGNQSSGGVNVYVTINSDGSASSETDKAGTEQFGREIGTIIESKYRQLLSSDLKDGGAIKNAIKAG